MVNPNLIKVPKQVLEDLLEVSPFMENTWSDFDTSKKWRRTINSIEEILNKEKKYISAEDSLFAKASARRDEEIRIEQELDKRSK